MRASDFFKSDYLGAADIPEGSEIAVRISGYEAVDFGDGDSKPALSFENKKRKMVLNKGNARGLVKAFGDDLSQWVGKDVVLFKVWTEYKGEPVQGLRIRPGQPQPPADFNAPRDAANAPPPSDDDIPFAVLLFPLAGMLIPYLA